MEISKLRQLDDKKLSLELDTAKTTLHKLMAEKAMMTMKDTSQLAKTKKTIAHIQTIVNERSKLSAYQNTNDK